MSDYTETFSEMHNPLISENNAVLAAGVYDSPWALMENYHRGVLVFNMIDMGAGATCDVSLRQATTAAGAGAKAFTAKAMTQLTQAGGDANTDSCIELRTEETDVTGKFCYVGVRLTVAVASVVCSYRFYGRVPRYPPAPTTGWNEIVA